MDYLAIAQELKNKQTALLNKAKEENRAFSQEETDSFTGMQKDIDSNLAMVEASQQADKNSAILNQPTEKLDTSADDTKSKAPEGFESFGDFLGAVINYGHPATGVRNADPRLFKSAATGLNEANPADGGFLVGTEVENTIMSRAYDMSKIAQRIEKTSIGANANGLKTFAVDETSRVNGSRGGGVQMYWANEADEKTASKPTFRKLELELNKLIGLCYLTDELIQDRTAMAGEVTSEFSKEMAFKLDDGVFRGTGAGQPLGILNSGALVSVAKEGAQAADTILFENVLNMWNRLYLGSMQNAVWYVNQDTLAQLNTMALVIGAGGVPVYLPPSGVSGAQYATLMGRPVIPVEQASTLGDKGDIVLADMGEYKGIDKGSMASDSSIHVRFIYDESVLRFVYRFDGQPKWNTALTPYKGTATVSPFITLDARA